jgi:flagellar M-ring protein FliF
LQNLFGNIVQQFSQFFADLSPIKRLSMISSMVVIMITGVVILVMVSGADYSPLLTNIPQDNIPMVLGELEKRSIPYRLINNGNGVAVPSSMLHATQMALMADLGTGKIGNVGLELFEKQDFGASNYSQRVNYQRGLQGELIRAINSLDSVKQSKVILALPPKKTFLEEGGQASASVVVEVHPGRNITPEQVRGITLLVASAVENLEADNVAVVDSNGKPLSKRTGGIGGESSELMDLKARIEGEFEDRIEAILQKVVGPGKVIARVNAQLNTKKIRTLEEDVDAERSAIRSVQTEEESLNGARTNPAGVPGARANLPGAEDQGQVGFNQNVKKELKTTNFTIPKTTRNIDEAAGSIERLSVAVLVDGNLLKLKNEGKVSEEWQPRSVEEMAKYETLVRNAIGFDEKRGDNVKIENIQFSKEDFSESELLITTLERRKIIRGIGFWLALGFIVALFFLVIVRPFMRWITDSFQETVDDMLPRTIEELEELQSVDNTLPGMSSALPVLEETMDPNKAESELLRERIMTMIEKDEEKAGSALTLWFNRKDA